MNVVLSGKKRASSNQPQFILPDGAALEFTIDGAPTSLVLDINGTEVTVSTDLLKTGLTAAPSSNNTALVDDTDAADQEDTRLWGEPEHRKFITIDNVGSEITALNGQIAAFMLDNGSSTEYFLARVNTTNNRLENCKRGFFYNSALNPKNRIFFSNNDTITLLKLGWIFVEDNATTVDVTYTNPHWGFESPSSPVTGDYWYDMANKVWKRYDGASFVIINRTLVGVFCNSTTACVGARSADFFAKYTGENSIKVDVATTEIIRGTKYGQRVNVAGQELKFYQSFPSWNITTDLASSSDMYDATEQASRMYYLYLKDTGEAVISDISPYYRQDFYAPYHPHNPWRCVGLAYNDGSNNLTAASGLEVSTDEKPEVEIIMHTPNAFGAVATLNRLYSVVQQHKGAHVIGINDANQGTFFTVYVPGVYGVDNISDSGSGNRYFYTTKNLADTTVDPTYDSPSVLGFYYGAVANTVGFQSSVRHHFKIGDVIRPIVDSTSGSNAGTAGVKIKVIKVE